MGNYSVLGYVGENIALEFLYSGPHSWRSRMHLNNRDPPLPGFLFQHAAVYDSLTVAQNVVFPLQHHRKDMSRSEQGNRVRQLLAEVGHGRRP
jgi:ABC-type transporter Mla maintaining outer membrane lipid asymmetry ATPase subunit MlaF